MNRLTTLAGALLACKAVAAPDQKALGKSEGYPVCAPSAPGEMHCLVGMVSHYDELLPARKVARGSAARLLMRAATGKRLSVYLSEKIWKPMGAEADASWIVDMGGHETAYAGVNATARDYARLGMLRANDGNIDGTQIVPASWIRAATTASAKQFEPGQIENFSGACCSALGYGYQTWILPGTERQFMLWGLRMQFIFVEPKSKIVMVHTAAGDNGPIPSELLALWSGVVRDLAE